MCFIRCVFMLIFMCVCVLLLQDLLQSCSRGGGRRVEDMCYDRRLVFITCSTYDKAVCVCVFITEDLGIIV